MNVLNPHTLPLHGRQVIEASAGTGKTWTLTALYLRLVLGHGRAKALLPPQILVMTFTEAATAELRERIRARLSQAAVCFDLSAQGREMPEAWPVDDFLLELRDSLDATLWPRCALQLSAAAQWMDEAAIYTIHGWSRRMLAQYALQSHDLFEQTRLENADELKLTLIHDYWREWFYPLPVDTLPHITLLVGQDPATLLAAVNDIWREQERKPSEPSQTSVLQLTPAQAIATHQAWLAQAQATAQAAREAWRDEVGQVLQHAIDSKTIRGKGITGPNLRKWASALTAWATQGADIDSKTLARFTPAALQDKGWAAARGIAFFERVQEHVQVLSTEPNTRQCIALHAASVVGAACRAAKAERAAFDFSDLLQNWHHAVMADLGPLCQALRQQYPVALVDEFQDTDPWQYGTLDRIYAPQDCTSDNALVMIGDPKQAIYSFRGADLGTYLLARRDAQTSHHAAQTQDSDTVHTLTGNYRSSAGLVKAVNHVFTQIEHPFACAQGEIAFVEATPEGQVEAFSVNGQIHAPLTVWHMPPEGQAKVVYSSHYMHHAAQVFAEQMAQLLNAQAATPGEMAVLVRSHKQADAVRDALRGCHIASVYLSDRTSVYQSSEALDLWRLLRAVASPRQATWLRAAIGSRLWALELQEVQAQTQDEAAWEQMTEQFQQWHDAWRQHGVLPMLHQWLHSQRVAQRLLAQANGERMLSNLLHLGELLQHAAQQLQGMHALVRFLGEQIQRPQTNNETQQTRLETDARCVKVITYHKSKGLQFPLVFVPFAGAFGVEKNGKANAAQDDKNDDDTDDANDSDDTPSTTDEDMRLLYVALTRAQQGLWLGVAETQRDLSGSLEKGTLKRSALSQLLKRQARGDLAAQLRSVWGNCEHIQIADLPTLQGTTYRAPVVSGQARDALQAKRDHHSLWWTASFSALTRGLRSESKHDEALADAITDSEMKGVLALGERATDPPEFDALIDDTDVPDSQAPDGVQLGAWQNFPAGASYGTLLHDLLEWLSLNQWPVANLQAPLWAQHTWSQLLARKARWLQLDDSHTALLQSWLKAVVQTPLPLSEPTAGPWPAINDTPVREAAAKPLTLCALTPEHLWPEMEFNLEVSQVSATVLDQLIQAHVLQGKPRPALQARVMQGMLTGSMDLVLLHDKRYWIVDYKSNKLPRYDSATLQDAVLQKRYDVQYVLYTLALHRLLKVRLPGYDYAQHMGGAVYLFMRGIDQSGSGIHANKPPLALIETLDQQFRTNVDAPFPPT